jgi:hypothetical protein
LEEEEIQKIHTTVPEHLVDDELLLSAFCAEDLVRRHSGGWDNDHPNCLFFSKPHTGSGLFQSSVNESHDLSDKRPLSGKQSRFTDVSCMKRKKDDPLKGRFLEVRKEIHSRYTDKREEDSCF